MKKDVTAVPVKYAGNDDKLESIIILTFRGLERVITL